MSVEVYFVGGVTLLGKAHQASDLKPMVLSDRTLFYPRVSRHKYDSGQYLDIPDNSLQFVQRCFSIVALVLD